MVRSVRQAARVAGVPASTMLRRLHRLQQEFGGTVLRRRGRGATAPYEVDEVALARLHLGSLAEYVPSRAEFSDLAERVEYLEAVAERLFRPPSGAPSPGRAGT